MGFHTPILLSNDFLGEMQRDPDRFFREVTRLMNDQGGTTWGNGLHVMQAEHSTVPRALYTVDGMFVEFSEYSSATMALGEKLPDHLRRMIVDTRQRLDNLQKALDKAEKMKS